MEAASCFSAYKDTFTGKNNQQNSRLKCIHSFKDTEVDSFDIRLIDIFFNFLSLKPIQINA
jgi:hypothetical protein